MDILRGALNIIFKEMNVEKILKEYLNKDFKYKPYCKELNYNDFTRLSYNEFPYYSKDEIKNIFYKIKEMMNKSIYLENNGTIFNLLIHFNESILEERYEMPVCKFEHLLRWRMISHKLDQDMFIASDYAYHDLLSCRERKKFLWDISIKSNNIRIHNMLLQGVADNHFHLKGSSPYFYLTWISLMNKVTNRHSEFKKSGIDINRLETDKNGHLSLEVLVYYAAIIRVILYCVLNNDFNYILDDLKYKNAKIQDKNKVIKKLFNDSMLNKIRINEIIEQLRYLKGKRFKYKDHEDIVDYFIDKRDDKKSNEYLHIFSGERKLLYLCFKKIYENDEAFQQYHEMFYIYLLIKAKFRSELIQVNERVGFSNFSDYQSRKSIFLKNEKKLKNALVNTAVISSIKNQNIASLECRIVPGETVAKNKELIENYDDIINNCIYEDGNNYWYKHKNNKEQNIKNIFNDYSKNKYYDDLKNKYFYVIHFPKVEDNDVYKKELSCMIKCRHYSVRKKLKYCCSSVAKLRNKKYKISNRILGIDACSNEIVCRPEIFAQSYRFLKNHFSNKRDFIDRINPPLKATYHVGEDFLDVADGLRAIDEAIKFLGLEHGDRLGHALALGIDVREWYDKKNRNIILSKQELLDNVAWIITKCKQFDIKNKYNIIYYLEPIFYTYFFYIFDNKKDFKNDYKERLNQITPDLYGFAWELRGDNPELYIEGYYKNCNCMTFWNRCSVRKSTILDSYRNNYLISKIYSMYHYDINVKRKGSEKCEFKIDDIYIKAVEEVQRHLQKIVSNKGIAIETNPSSNYLIGNFKRYEKHPIVNFYNIGLTSKEEKLNNCPQLYVSINTDDQGVFDTLLENEYALMAIALQKSKDNNGEYKYNTTMIYNWLNNIRKMGLEQSFQLMYMNNMYKNN